jgi:hypothetical protein
MTAPLREPLHGQPSNSLELLTQWARLGMTQSGS